MRTYYWIFILNMIWDNSILTHNVYTISFVFAADLRPACPWWAHLDLLMASGRQTPMCRMHHIRRPGSTTIRDTWGKINLVSIYVLKNVWKKIVAEISYMSAFITSVVNCYLCLFVCLFVFLFRFVLFFVLFLFFVFFFLYFQPVTRWPLRL